MTYLSLLLSWISAGFFSLSPLYAEILWDFSHELHEFNTHGMLGIYKRLCMYVCMCVSAALGCAVVWEGVSLVSPRIVAKILMELTKNPG